MNASIPAWESGHTLPTEVKQRMIPLLNQQLADAIDLGLQAKQAHWNVKGPQFVSLHALFDEAAELLGELADELAERAVALGGIADGTLQAVAARTRLAAYDRNMLAGTDHLQAFGAALAHFARSNRAAIESAAAAGDAATADLFTEASRAADKLLWKVSAHTSAAT
jgi:starvation-inducible DNA-binding protein